MASRSTIRTTPQKELDNKLKVLTNSPVVFTSKNCTVFQFTFNNKTAGTITVTVTDAQSSPLDLITALSLTANSVTVVSIPEGQYMPGGFSWNASANTSVNASVVGFVEGT